MVEFWGIKLYLHEEKTTIKTCNMFTPHEHLISDKPKMSHEDLQLLQIHADGKKDNLSIPVLGLSAESELRAQPRVRC